MRCPFPALVAVAALAVPPPAPAGELTLPQLLELAARNSPDLAAARAAADAARGRHVQAGLYPNPVVAARSDEIANRAGPWGKPGVTLSQEIVTMGKLRLAQLAASEAVDAAEWQALTRWRDVALRVRLAWVDALTARREVAVNERLVKLALAAQEGAEKLLGAGRGSPADTLRAGVERAQAEARLGVARQRLDAATRLLAAALGLPQLPLCPLADPLDTPTPEFPWQPLLDALLARSTEMREAEALARQGDALARQAEANRCPNITVTARPFYSSLEGDRNAQVLVEVGAPLPLYNRNQGAIAAARADALRLWGLVRDRELRLTERLAGAYQRYHAARGLAEAYRLKVVPDAEKALALVRLGYDRGEARSDFTAVLQAQQVLAQAELAQVQALAEQWRARAELIALLQEEEPCE